MPEPGCVAIKKGVPCRNGVWKHRVVDGPRTLQVGTNRLRDEVVGVSGNGVSLSCAISVEYGTPLIGERGDSFVVSLRLQSEYGGLKTSDRTGYNELSAAIWTVLKTRPCPHGSRLGDKLVLDPGCTAVSGIATSSDLAQYGSLAIFLTAFNPAARWRALLCIAQHNSDEVYGFTPVMLRGQDCCFRCAVEQTERRAGAGTWCVVL
jgi:hypothetical protein